MAINIANNAATITLTIKSPVHHWLDSLHSRPERQTQWLAHQIEDARQFRTDDQVCASSGRSRVQERPWIGETSWAVPEPDSQFAGNPRAPLDPRNQSAWSMNGLPDPAAFTRDIKRTRQRFLKSALHERAKAIPSRNFIDTSHG